RPVPPGQGRPRRSARARRGRLRAALRTPARVTHAARRPLSPRLRPGARGHEQQRTKLDLGPPPEHQTTVSVAPPVKSVPLSSRPEPPPAAPKRSPDGRCRRARPPVGLL